MPPLFGEIAGTFAVVVLLLLIALVIDPDIRATRKTNRALRAHRKAVR